MLAISSSEAEVSQGSTHFHWNLRQGSDSTAKPGRRSGNLFGAAGESRDYFAEFFRDAASNQESEYHAN